VRGFESADAFSNQYGKYFATVLFQELVEENNRSTPGLLQSVATDDIDPRAFGQTKEEFVNRVVNVIPDIMRKTGLNPAQQPPLNRTAFTDSWHPMGQSQANTDAGDAVHSRSTPIGESVRVRVPFRLAAAAPEPSHSVAVSTPSTASSNEPTPFVPDPINYGDTGEGVSVRRAQPVAREKLQIHREQEQSALPSAPLVRRAEPTVQPAAAVKHWYIVSYFTPEKEKGPRHPMLAPLRAPMKPPR
jgi:hypothetical protein